MPELPGAPPPALTRHLGLIESALRSAIDGIPGGLGSALRYVMGWETEHGHPSEAAGKRIRPALCVFGAEAAGGKPGLALPGAVAVELIHNFSLVHDEVQDHDAVRHGRPTLWASIGEGQAINAGDRLLTAAIDALVLGDGPVERRMAALRVLNVAVARMIDGQWLDIAFEAREAVSVAEYQAMSAGKTGALLGAPLEMGALLAGGGPGFASTLGRWGVQVGLAFQAQDDYLGIWGDPNNTGKSNSNDIVRKKKTLPVVHGLLSPDHASVIRRAYAAEALDEAAIASVTAALTEAGADQICRTEARVHAAEADALLTALDLSPEMRAEFQAIAAFMVDRSF